MKSFCAYIVTLACASAGFAFAQGNPTGVCVYNCGSPTPPPQRTSPGTSVPSGAAAAVGTAIGNAIGKAVGGGQQGADPRENEAVQRRLDEWESEPSANPPAQQMVSDHGGLLASRAESLEQPGSNDSSPNATLRVINQTNTYVTVSVDGSYGCNTAGGTMCAIPVRKGGHQLRAVRADTGASFSQPVDISGKEFVWSLSGS
jgi:hypothetical protein